MESTGLTKKDLHTLNEQKRRDVIKVYEFFFFSLIYIYHLILLLSFVFMMSACFVWLEIARLCPTGRPRPVMPIHRSEIE